MLQVAVVDGREEKVEYDCRPLAIIERFELRKPQYLVVARNGHFGRVGVGWEEGLLK